MTTKNVTGIIAWLKGWFFDKDEITTKEQALQTQINNKASQSDLNTTNGNVSTLQSQMSSKASQSDLDTTNGNVATLQSKVDALENVELVKIVSTLPPASASTINTLYVVTNGGSTSTNLYSIYVTVKSGNNYSWEKVDDADLQGFITADTANATFAPKAHAVNASTYGLGTTGVYGHVKIVNGLTQTGYVDGRALSAYQGKVLKDLVDGCVVDIELVPKTTDSTGAIKLIYSNEPQQ